MEFKRFLGEHIVDNQPIYVYELRYENRNRIKIQLYHKPEKTDGPLRDFGELSVELGNMCVLEQGEFCVRNYGKMKQYIKELEAFTEFEDTPRRQLITMNYYPGDKGTRSMCPIWRLRSYDCMPDDPEVNILANEGGILTTSVAECTFEEIKRLVKGTPTNKEIAQHTLTLKTFDDHFLKDNVGNIVKELLK